MGFTQRSQRGRGSELANGSTQGLIKQWQYIFIAQIARGLIIYCHHLPSSVVPEPLHSALPSPFSSGTILRIKCERSRVAKAARREPNDFPIDRRKIVSPTAASAKSRFVTASIRLDMVPLQPSSMAHFNDSAQWVNVCKRLWIMGILGIRRRNVRPNASFSDELDTACHGDGRPGSYSTRTSRRFIGLKSFRALPVRRRAASNVPRHAPNQAGGKCGERDIVRAAC